MIFAELLLTMAIAFLAIVPASSVVALRSDKNSCKEKCGKVKVPFPFGIGDSKCFKDDRFEMVCDGNATSEKLFLKHLQLEVLNVTMYNDGSRNDLYGQQVKVRAPITFFNCPGRNTARGRVDLTKTPFSLSSDNMFIATSCGVRAQLNSSSGNIFSQNGCTSSCSRDNTISAAPNHEDNLCDQIDCCQTSVASTSDSFEISFDHLTSNIADDQQISDQCKFAFVIDINEWPYSLKRSLNFAKTGYTPLMLDWDFANYTYSDILETEAADSASVWCQNISYSSSMFENSFQCRCSYGFRGNPYLPYGCKDINECAEAEQRDICRGWGSSCVNTYGYYRCSYKKKFLLIGFGSAFGALFILLGSWGLYKKIKKRKETTRKKNFFKRNGGLLLRQQLSSGEGNVEKTKLFDSNELDKATVQFSVDRILGHGGQGTVYKGMLDDGKIVAVKKSKIIDEEKLSEFINEVVILSQINHRNIVQLLGCCLETEVPLLVYEFIPNGTLSQYIHEKNDEFPFKWKMRLRIAAEVAGALSYLHSAASFPIYHRDMKSSNILLDEKYRAKVADFGTSRTISLEQTHLTTLVYGTLGYLDPEYFQSSQLTDKSDVYSFGVVLVELLTGQKAICATRADEERNLATHFTISMEENRLFDVVDSQVLEDAPKEEILIVACLALRCLSASGRNRPTMKEVEMELEGLRKPERDASTNPKQTYEEMEYVRTELVEPWDVVTVLTSAIERTNTGSSLQQESPLLSCGSK